MTWISLLVMPFAFLVLCGCRKADTTPKVTCAVDFRHDRSIARVPWPGDHVSQVFTKSDVNLAVDFGESWRFEGHVKDVAFTRRGDFVANMTFGLPNMAADRAYHETKRLAGTWHLSQQPLDVWYAKVRAGVSSNVAMMRNDREPAISIEIRKSFDADNPYFLYLSIGWHD